MSDAGARPAGERRRGQSRSASMSRLRQLLRRRPRRTAFVLSGGGNLGALQVGMLRALLERDVVPDLVVGCSVGALNGAAVAADPTPATVARLEDVWRGLDDHDVMPAGLLPRTFALARRGLAIHPNDNLRRVVEGVLPARTFEELQLPFHCVAAAIDEGVERWFDEGPLVEAILASAALPAVYPPVEIDGVRYLDGAVVNDVPVSRAVQLGADRIFVLHVGAWDRPRPEPRRPFEMAMYAYWLARRSRFQRDLASIPSDIEVLVLPPGDKPSIRYHDFGHSDEMIATAHAATAAFLDDRHADRLDDLAAAVPPVHPEDRPGPVDARGPHGDVPWRPPGAPAPPF